MKVPNNLYTVYMDVHLRKTLSTEYVDTKQTSTEQYKHCILPITGLTSGMYLARDSVNFILSYLLYLYLPFIGQKVRVQ